MVIWIFWLVLGAAFMIVEVMSLSMLCMYAGIGSFAATGCALAGYGWTTCITVFLIVTVVLYLATYRWRGRLLSALHKGARHTGTGMDALIGRTGIVEVSDQYRVRIDGDCWPVRPAAKNGELIPGETVRVVGYDSIVLSVEPIMPE